MENTAAIVSPFVTLISALILWFLNERSKQHNAIYLEKLKLYEKLLSSISAIYEEGTLNPKLKNEFDNNFRVSWLYAPTEVIYKLCSFLETVRVGNNSSHETVDCALDLLVRAIRNDLKLPLPKQKFMVWKTN